jgi:putative ABC transport system ATP-binding protein
MLTIKSVSKFYNKGPAMVTALDSVSLEIQKGDFVAVMGPSGSGKSTLLNILGGLDSVSGGEVMLEGKRIDSLSEEALVQVRRGEIAYIFQQYHLLSSLTALENVMLPLTFSGDRKGRQRALEMLNKVGLEKRAGHKPAELSGGEQQRVAIARALISEPALILADEPTGNVDQATGKQIMGLLAELNREGRTIIIVTHDPGVAEYAGTVIHLRDGQVLEIDTRKQAATA